MPAAIAQGNDMQPKTKSKDLQSVFAAAARDLNININASQSELFNIYCNELQEWTRKTNITTITNTDDIFIKHFLDSLTVLKHVPLKGRVADIGSGGGFPGIPLKIAQPALNVILIETSRKKANFLRHLIRLFSLKGIEVFNGRAQEFDQRDYFDYALSRAFGDLDKFCKIALPLLKKAGFLVAMKGRNIENELEKFSGGAFAGKATIVKKVSFYLPSKKGKRTLIVLRKEKCFT